MLNIQKVYAFSEVKEEFGYLKNPVSEILINLSARPWYGDYILSIIGETIIEKKFVLLK